MESTSVLMMKLIRECIDKDFCADIAADSFSDQALSELYKLAASHDVAHLVASSLELRSVLKNGKPHEAFKRSLMLSAYRHEGQAYEIDRICRVFESQHIPFMLLKGSELCYEYPQAYLRTRSDIDVLVKTDQLDAAKKALCRELSYIENTSTGSSHDISLMSEGGVHIELHYSLWDEDIESCVGKSAAVILKGVWKSAELCGESLYRYRMNEALFGFYHYVHMAKHVLNGGCGVKPFVDIMILKKRGGECERELYRLAQEGKIDTFILQVNRLAEVWFADAQHDGVSRAFEQYVLCGGVYGTVENRLSVGQEKKHGKMGYALSRVFLPWSVLKYRYPILKKHRWLTPVFEVVRWFSLVFGGKATRAITELKINAGISDEKAEMTRELIKNIGL